MRRHLSHLSFANVASATALTLVLGGGVAVAAGLAPNSVGPAQIKKDAVRSSDVKNNALKGKDIKESSLGSVPSVDTVVTTSRVAAAVGAVPVTIGARGPFTFTLRCLDAGGGAVRALLEIRTSVDNASYIADADAYDDFDVFSGPQTVAETNDIAPDMAQASFAATTAGGTLYQGIGYVASKLQGSAGCVAQLTFLG
jgi:hypothetical protein